jgi:septal ring factor EnvC (AmiA/AmiB activator)
VNRGLPLAPGFGRFADGIEARVARQGRRVCGFTALLAAALTLLPAAAGDTETQLKELRARLFALQQELDETRGKRDTVRDELHGLERRIGGHVQELRRADARLQSLNGRLARLRRQAEKERAQARRHEQLAERTLRAAYAAGREPQLKLLLSVEEPARLARLMAYHGYVQRAHAREVATLERSLAGLARVEEQIREQGRELAEARAAQTREKQALEASRARRTELLASLNREVRDRGAEVERLKSDRARLERLLTEIRPILPAVPPPAASGERFSRLAGRLALPARGRIVAQFNEPKGLGDLRWRGIFIAAREGEVVRAVARGRVAYADALRGFGLLLILDHGDGYMTLYGHNQSLARQAGEWVEAGEVIGLVGNTGDAPRPGLYFEIRYRGEPHDPLRWCVARAP